MLGCTRASHAVLSGRTAGHARGRLGRRRPRNLLSSPLSERGRLGVGRRGGAARRGAGSHALNPATGEALPVWVADYVLGGYGSGAIMAVPAHDARDFDFAAAFGLPVRRVVAPADAGGAPGAGAQADLPFTGARRPRRLPAPFAASCAHVPAEGGHTCARQVHGRNRGRQRAAGQQGCRLTSVSGRELRGRGAGTRSGRSLARHGRWRTPRKAHWRSVAHAATAARS
jgi:hypothetical protein